MFDLNDETRWILGRPNFTLMSMAQVLRLSGHDIPQQAEDEQGACIYWMLCMYEKYGASWREEATKYLREAKAAYEAASDPTPSAKTAAGETEVSCE